MPTSFPPSEDQGPEARRPVRLALGAVLAYALFSPFWIPVLAGAMRERLARGLPEEWARVANGGSLQVASPYVVGSVAVDNGFYAMRARQVLLRGLPLDPFTQDGRPGSWLFDSAWPYFLAGCSLLAGGDLQWGFVLASGAAAALKVLAFFLLFRHAGGCPRAGLVAALATFLFWDALSWLSLLAQTLAALPFSGDASWLPSWLVQLPRRIFNPPHVQDSCRFPSVGLTSVWVLGCLAGAYRLGRSPRELRGRSALSGLATGFLGGFLHFFEWSFTVATLACWTALSPWAGLPAAGRRNAAWSFAGAAAGAGAFLALAQSLTGSARDDLIQRVAWPVTFHSETVTFLLYAGLCGLAARRDAPRRSLWLLFLALFAAVSLLSLAQYVVGYDLQFTYHYAAYGNLAAGVAGVAWVLARGHAFRRGLGRHAWVLLGALCAWDFSMNKAWSEKYFRLYGAPRPLERSLRWLGSHGAPGAILVTASPLAYFGLPFWTHARTLVSPGLPSYGNPLRSRSENLRGLAVMLKAGGFDVEAFLRERWFGFQEREERAVRLSFFTRDHAEREREGAMWAYGILNEMARRPEALARSAEEIRRSFRTQPPLERPYYLWLHEEETRLLSRPPEERGGRRVFQEGPVSIYLFDRTPGFSGAPPGAQ